MIILISVLWVLYSVFAGTNEGFFFHHKDKATDNLLFDLDGDGDRDVEIHQIFSLMRLIVLIVMGVALYGITQSLFFTAVLIFSYAMMFPFFHDGSYYVTRNNLNHNIYKKKWFAQSNTSTAKSTRFLTPTVRTTAFILGLISIVLTIIYA